jgi:DHA1 family tetracycline resistance protein-like MFS transporter
MSPWWYYGMSAPLQGIISWSTVALSSLTDAVPQAHHRAPSFGLAMAGLAIGFALGPMAVVQLGHVGVSILSLFMICVALTFAIWCVPETLSPQASARAKMMRQQQQQQQHYLTNTNGNNNKQRWFLWYMYRPMWELSILNRDHLFRLLALLAFLCGIVSSGDKSLILYYIQEQLGFTDQDIAHLFLVVGILGIVSQACLLKILNDAIGERGVVMLGFGLGTIHNALYGLATTKSTIFIAASIATIVAMIHPTLAAILSNNVQECEYGRIQGALASLHSLAAAFGPMTLRFVYHCTKDGGGGAFMEMVGPGSMFIFASGLYAIAACCSYFLPPVSLSLFFLTVKKRFQNSHTELRHSSFLSAILSSPRSTRIIIIAVHINNKNNFINKKKSGKGQILSLLEQS